MRMLHILLSSLIIVLAIPALASGGQSGDGGKTPDFDFDMQKLFSGGDATVKAFGDSASAKGLISTEHNITTNGDSPEFSVSGKGLSSWESFFDGSDNDSGKAFGVSSMNLWGGTKSDGNGSLFAGTISSFGKSRSACGGSGDCDVWGGTSGKSLLKFEAGSDQDPTGSVSAENLSFAGAKETTSGSPAEAQAGAFNKTGFGFGSVEFEYGD